MKKISESNILVVLNALKTTVETFAGPFLAAYFVSSTMQSLSVLVKYNLILYFFCGITPNIIARFSSNGNQHRIFSAGVILAFISILFIAVMKEKLISYYYILAVIYGISEQLYYFAYNSFIIGKIPDSERGHFENSRTLITRITAITIPIVLGNIIASSDFTKTAFVILIVSFAMVICSFGLTKLESNGKFDYKNSLPVILKSKYGTRFMFASISEGFYLAISKFVFPALVFMNNNSNTGLGYLTSLSSLLFVVGQVFYILARKKTQNAGNFILWLAPVAVVLPMLIYCIFPSLTTIVIAYIAFNVFNQLFQLPGNVRKYSSMHLGQEAAGSKEILVFSENCLAVGRCLSMIIMLVALSISTKIVPYVFLVILSAIIPNSIIVRKIGIDS